MRLVAGADNDKMVRVRVQRSEREYLARVLRHAKRNERSKIDWIHLAERTSRYFIYLHLIVLFCLKYSNRAYSKHIGVGRVCYCGKQRVMEKQEARTVSESHQNQSYGK